MYSQMQMFSKSHFFTEVWHDLKVYADYGNIT